MKTSEEWLADAVRFDALANELKVARDDYGHWYFRVRAKTALDTAIQMEQTNGKAS